MSDSALAPVEQREEDGLVDAFNAVRDELFSRLYFMLGHYEDAQDALQIAFLHCWQARDCLPQLRNVRAWIWRVSLNAGRDLRDQVWRRRAKPLGDVEAAASAPHQPPAETLVKKEQRERLRAALVHLRPEEKEVFLLRQNEELTFEAIARRRGRPVGTGKTLMRSAVHRLRRVLQENETCSAK
jgi:RNA polymerase sigma-70 factor (ECF subfamily)